MSAIESSQSAGDLLASSVKPSQEFLDGEELTVRPADQETDPSLSTHLRKSCRPRKLVASDREEATDDADASERSPRGSNGPSASTDAILESSETDRRKSLRPRRNVKFNEAFQDDKELDHLLDDEHNLQAYGPAQHWNTGSDYLSNDWLSVEKILAHRVLSRRKLTDFLIKAEKSYPPGQRKMVQLEYFVKFHDQSYWHCAWVPGAILLALHPGLVRNHLRNVPIDGTDSNADLTDQVNRADTDETAPQLPTFTDTTSCTAPEPTESALSVDAGRNDLHADGDKSNFASIVISHSSQEESDDEECLNHWSFEHKENVLKWISPKLENFGARRRYLIKWGVECQRLIPERILAVGEEATVSGFVTTNDEFTDNPQDPMDSVEYHEVLVKWLDVPQNQATWETVERDMDMLNSVDAYQCASGRCILKDSGGQKLLPSVVRRHIIQLTDAHRTRIAQMLCDAYGSHDTVGKRPPQNFGDWKDKWKGGQPDYLSPEQHSKLYPYQLDGVRWLWHAYHNHVNAILADEMGLGKTVQVIALLYSLWKERNDYGPFLIIAPLSTLLNWQREFELWAPDFIVLVYSGDRNVRVAMQEHEFRIPNSGGVAAFHVMITSHELACLERSVLQGFDWSALIVDEAHRLKNKQSRLFKETSQYKATFKMLLTGTPLQNNLEELFHLLYFVEPKSISDFKTLAEQWADMPKSERIASLHDQLKHHLLRRLKSDVIQDLPKKYEITVMVDMSVLQRKLYKLVLTKNYEELRCGSLMNSLVHLQKICDHPYLLPVGDAIAPRIGEADSDVRYEPRALIQVSGKLVVLIEMLRGLRERGHRVLIYSRMTTMLDLLEEALVNEGYAFERIDGRVKGPLRQIIVDRFNAPNCEVFVFLLSTRAGGEGINLASADTVILYDSDWNPQCDLQALSRAHRIGQSRPVVVYRFITRHTMEERINLVARRKLALTDLVVNNSQQRKQPKVRSSKAKDVASNTGDQSHSGEQQKDDAGTALVDESAAACNSSSETSNSQKTIQQGTTGSVSARLTRAEMDDMLRCGLDVLFSVDDLLDENELHKAACVQDEDGKTDESTRIIYDTEAINRLLDRTNLEESADDLKSAADEYLGTFRVAHFDAPSVAKPSSSSSAGPEPGPSDGQPDAVSVPLTDDVQQDEQEKPPAETLGYAAFWDRLLKERYNRLCESETQIVPGLSKRHCRATWRMQQASRDEFSDSDKESVHREVSANHDEVGETCEKPSSRVSTHRHRTSHPDSSNNITISGDVRLSGGRHRPQNRRPKKGSKKFNVNAETGPSAANSSSPSDEDQPYDASMNSDEDPSYIPSDDDSDEIPQDVTLVKKWRKRERQTVHGPGELDRDGTCRAPIIFTDSLGNVDNDTFCTAVWHPHPSVCSKWREAANALSPKIIWERGYMFIYGFGPHDRQAFANAVMRYGLPPPSIVPPQEWLPSSLFSKNPLNLYAYTALFMQHLYEDPNALDDTKTTWSDGLPKEKLCAPAVLSRIAMMALIRNKVLQFEDINGVHSRTFEALSTRFKFSIHDGGLTMLRATWHDEWRRINQMVEGKTPQPGSSVKREEAMGHLQRIWHSRHDYWLLAAVHVHGYLRWTDILTDPRFFLLSTGLEGVLEDMGLRGETQKNGETSSVTQTNMAEAQAFLVSRLRLLEQALLVEQALFEVAQAALTSTIDGVPPPLGRVQNLAVCLSNKLAAAGPRKRIALPRDPRASEATKIAVRNLQDLLEDIYADLPGLPASILCAEAEVTSPNVSTSGSTAIEASNNMEEKNPDVPTSAPSTQNETGADDEPATLDSQSVSEPSSPPCIKPSISQTTNTDIIEISDGED